MVRCGEDTQEGVVVGFVFCGWEVGGEDVAGAAVDYEAGRYGGGFLVLHCLCFGETWGGIRVLLL